MGEENENMERLRSYFTEELRKIGRDGIIGVASFVDVYGDLISVQKRKLKELCGTSFQNLMGHGSIISIGLAYSENAIDSINVVVDGDVDKNKWNEYGLEYEKINRYLDTIARNIADKFGGKPVAATLGGFVGKVKNVKEYFPLTISHRVVAENAGLGWRGKNELVINERYGCAIRFASISTETRLPQGKKIESRCGSCSACLDVCSILKNKNNLKDYRESCRKFIISLGLQQDVCGKCIAACYRKSIFKDRFRLIRL